MRKFATLTVAAAVVMGLAGGAQAAPGDETQQVVRAHGCAEHRAAGHSAQVDCQQVDDNAAALAGLAAAVAQAARDEVLCAQHEVAGNTASIDCAQAEAIALSLVGLADGIVGEVKDDLICTRDGLGINCRRLEKDVQRLQRDLEKDAERAERDVARTLHRALRDAGL